MPDDRLKADAYFAVVPEWVIDSVSPRALQVYAYLRRYANYETLVAWPSRKTLAERCNCGATTIKRAVQELRDAGAITTEPRFDETGEQTSNLYWLHAAPPMDTRGAADGPPRGAADGPPPRAADGPLSKATFELKPLEQEGSAPPRKRDYLWESFVAVHGEPATDTERGKYNRTVALLREAEVTPDEYPLLVVAYTTKHGDGLQPGVATIAQRVGELRHYVAQGPVRGPSKVDQARWRARQAIGDADDTR